MFSFEEFDFGGVQDKYDSSKGFESGEGGNKGKQVHSYGTEHLGESGGIDSLCSDYGFYQQNTAEEGFWLSKYQQHEQQQPPLSDYGSSDDFVPTVIQPCLEEITKPGEIPTGTPDKYNSSKGSENGEGGNKGKQTHSYGTEYLGESGGIDSRSSDFGFYPGNTAEGGLWLSKYQQHEQQQPLFSDYESFDDFVFPPIQPCLEEITRPGEIPTGTPHLVEPKKEKQYPFPLASLQLLNNYRSGLKRLNREKINDPSYDTKKGSGHELSTQEIMRVAGARFIQSDYQGIDGFSMLSHPFGSYLSCLPDEKVKDVKLAELLLASAKKVGYQQFDSASKLLNQCDYLCSNTGNAVQRVVYYFSEALREKIDRETGRITSKGLGKKLSYDLDEAMMRPNLTPIACHQGVPFSQIAEFSGIQAIVEYVAKAKKVHVIDFKIWNGVQWTVLMQALADRCECPLELLKITAVGTRSKPEIEDTGKRLLDFAQSMNLPFSFKIVMVSDILHLKEDLFELETDEVVAVYSPFVLTTMVAQPNRLESLMRVIRSINPCIILVTEIEANLNSPSFINRFIEALFFYSAYFDCLEACMDQDEPNRMITESIFFSQAIRNIVATEGEERTIRHVKIGVWREFFAQLGMMEIELSMSSLYQASLVVKKFACGSSCTLDMNGKCLLLGWKGTPLHSLSAWKFH